MKKLILLSLTLGLTFPAAHVLAGGWLSRAQTKPTFGRLVDKQVWSTIIALKKQMSEGIRLPHDVIGEILDCYLTDKTIDVRIRTNIALEFLADPNYKNIHQLLLNIIESEFAIYAYPLAKELGYDQTVQQLLLPSISKGCLETLKTLFSNDSSFIWDNKTPLNMLKTLKENLGKANLLVTVNWCVNELGIETTFPLLSDKDLLTLLKYMFSLDVQNLISKTEKSYHKKTAKLRAVLMALKDCASKAGERNIDLNFENEEGLTPLLWITTLPVYWRDNGHSEALQEVLFQYGAKVDCINKYGKTFYDLNPQIAENRRLLGYMEDSQREWVLKKHLENKKQ